MKKTTVQTTLAKTGDQQMELPRDAAVVRPRYLPPIKATDTRLVQMHEVTASVLRKHASMRLTKRVC